MKRQPLNPFILSSILFIANDRKPFFREMDADLILPTCQQLDFKQAVTL